MGEVDIFNAISGQWSTAVLSVGRRYVAATSLPNQGLAIFAGGYSGLLFLLHGCWCFSMFWFREEGRGHVLG
jgi:hypothetical protein